MLLAIDARNRAIVVGIRASAPSPGEARDRGSGWLALRRLGAISERSEDEYAFLFREIFRDIPSRAADRSAAGPDAAAARRQDAIEAAWLSSVVPAMTGRICEGVRTAFGVTCSVVGPGTRTGVKIRTDVPSEVGADLVCAAAAAREIVGGPCIIVDFGTAISLSAVNGAGEFLGCAIAPGIAAAAESLRSATAQIPEVRLDSPVKAIGRTTAQSVQSGILLGYGGLVQRLVELIRGEMAPADCGPIQVIGTGDPLGRSLLASIGYDRFIPDLALEGLAIIAARSAP